MKGIMTMDVNEKLYSIEIIVEVIGLSNLQGMSKIGGYLSVFHEKEVNGLFNWETMNIKFYEINKPQWYKHMTSNMPFLFSSSVVTVYVIYDTYKINKLGNISGYEIFKLLVALVFFMTIFIIYLLNKNMNSKMFAKKWRKLLDED